MKKTYEQYYFDTWLDFTNKDTDYTQSFLQVFPNVISHDNKEPLFLLNVFGTDCDTFNHFSLKITEGTASHQTDYDIDASAQYYIYPTSPKGTIQLKDNDNEYTLTWEKLNDEVYKFTNTHCNRSIIFIQDVGTLPADITSLKESYIDSYNTFSEQPFFQMLSEAGLTDELSYKQYIFKKLQELEKLGTLN